MSDASKKVVLITGASRGIGFEFCYQFLLLGYYVIAAVRKSNTKLEDLLHNKGEIIELDVAQADSISNLSKKLKNINHIDILINNAGVLRTSETQIADEIIESIKVNALAPFLIFQELQPLLKKSKTPTVVNITSLMGSIRDNSSGGYYAYRMSKAALNMCNKSLSIDHPNITSIVLHPGWVKTDMGGPNGQLSVQESVMGMMKVIKELNKDQNGKFFNYVGKELPW